MRSAFLATAALMLMSSPSFADLISYAHTSAAASTTVSDAFTLPAFDPSLGTLTAIEIIQMANVADNVTISNANTVSESFTNVASAVNVTVTGGPGNMLLGYAIGLAPYISGLATPGTSEFTASSTSGTSSEFLPSTDFAAYTTPAAPPTLVFDSTGTVTTGSSGVPGLIFGASASVDGTTEIIYTYDSNTIVGPILSTSIVPEPASLAILGLGLAGVMRLRRTR